MMVRDVTLGDNIIDPRGVAQRVEELEGEREGLVDALSQVRSDDEHDPADLHAKEAALEEWDAENGEELKLWREFASETSLEEVCIHDSHFTDYAMELADDCGMLPRDVTWPLTCIDWEQAARELQHDYSSFEVDGHTYWTRS